MQTLIFTGKEVKQRSSTPFSERREYIILQVCVFVFFLCVYVLTLQIYFILMEKIVTQTEFGSSM